jgi:hypothetical protein
LPPLTKQKFFLPFFYTLHASRITHYALRITLFNNASVSSK